MKIIKWILVVLIFLTLTISGCAGMTETQQDTGDLVQPGVRKSGVSTSPLPPDEVNRRLLIGSS